MTMNLTTSFGRATRVALASGLSNGVRARTLQIMRDVPPEGGFGYQILDQAQSGAPDLRQETLPLVRAAHGRPAARRRPHRRDDGADHQTLRADLIRQPAQIGVASIDADVGIEQK